MMKLYKNENGEKLYPVCNWEKNQHKLYNANDRIWNAIYDAQENKASADELDKLYDRKDEIERVICIFDSQEVTFEELQKLSYIPGGMELLRDSLIIKDIIWVYNARH